MIILVSKHTISLDNFAGWEGEVHGVRVVSNLAFSPYEPVSDVQVDVGRIARAARFGNLESLIFNRYSREDSLSVGVDSVASNGGATAVLSAAAVKVGRVETELAPSGIPFYSQGQGTIKINFGHGDLQRVNAREAEPLARHINLAVKEGLLDESYKQLLGSKINTLAGLSAFAMAASAEIADSGSVAKGLLMGLVFSSTMYTLTFNANRQKLMHPGQLVPFLSLERLAAVQAYTRSRDFVRTK